LKTKGCEYDPLLFTQILVYPEKNAGDKHSRLFCLALRNKEIKYNIYYRSRKTGSLTMVSYMSSGFVYAKVANLVLFFRADPRLGLVYLLLFILQGMLLPEPTYKG
jgi:hypothetical protein